MKLLKKILIIFIILGALSIIFLSWYSAQHSMEEAMPMEINDKSLPQHVLIATQGSKFKNAVVQETIGQLKSLPVYIKVIDVGQLTSINESEWSVIVILHTWEYGKPQKNVLDFVINSTSKNKIVVLCTSGSGKEKMEGIDGITSASWPEEVIDSSDKIVNRIKSILNI
jgi:soluble P-type ATPase